MKMNKNTKIALGVGLVGVAAYLIYKQMKSSSTAGFSGGMLSGRQRQAIGGSSSLVGCPCQKVDSSVPSWTDSWGRTWVQCAGGQACCTKGVTGHPCPKNKVPPKATVLTPEEKKRYYGRF